jgi:hypothetical protein
VFKKYGARLGMFPWLAVFVEGSLSLWLKDNRARKRKKEWDRELRSYIAGLMRAGPIVLMWNLPGS